MRQVFIILLILGLCSFSSATVYTAGPFDLTPSTPENSAFRKVFLSFDYQDVSRLFNSWDYKQDTTLIGEWKFVLFSIDPVAKKDLWWVTSVDEKIIDTGFRNNFDGSEFNTLSIGPKYENNCDGSYVLEVRNILYAGLNQGPHCLRRGSLKTIFEFQQYGMTPSLDWKTDAWYLFQCRKKEFEKEYFMLCHISLGGDWTTGDSDWNAKIQKWLGKNFSYFGFWKKKN